MVAGGMAEGIVVALEVIEIEHHDRDRTMPAAGGVEFAFEEFLHVAAVVKSGEWIAHGLEAKRFAETEIGNRNRDVFSDCAGEVEAAGGVVGVGVWFGSRRRCVAILKIIVPNLIIPTCIILRASFVLEIVLEIGFPRLGLWQSHFPEWPGFRWLPDRR